MYMWKSVILWQRCLQSTGCHPARVTQRRHNRQSQHTSLALHHGTRRHTAVDQLCSWLGTVYISIGLLSKVNIYIYLIENSKCYLQSGALEHKEVDSLVLLLISSAFQVWLKTSYLWYIYSDWICYITL